jgi:hypothetical protein
MRAKEDRMGTLDELVAKQAAYEAKVAACPHDFTGRSLYGDGPVCSKCGVLELAWLRRRLGEASGCIKMLVRCAVPNAKEHPTMWDAWGDASEWLGEDRNRHRIPHVEMQGNERASGRALR